MVCELDKSLNDRSLALKEVTSFVINRDKIVVDHMIYRRAVKTYLNCSQNTAGPGRWFSGHSTWHEDLPEFRPQTRGTGDRLLGLAWLANLA